MTELFKRLDHWHLQQPGIVRPSRQHSMRYILHQFLLKQEQRGGKRHDQDQSHCDSLSL
jgi:hypothetical protein